MSNDISVSSTSVGVVAPQAIVVNFPAAGVYPYEIDFAKGGDGKLTLRMLANNAAIASNTQLTLTPVLVSSTTSGQAQSLVVTAKDDSGVVLSNLPVTVTVVGQNPQTRQVVTDGTGQAGFAYAGSPTLSGVDQVQASALVAGVTAVSNVVSLPWNNGANAAPVVSAGPGRR